MSSRETSGSRDPRVLVVDDTASVRRFHAVILEAAGFDVVEADGGRSALRILRNDPSIEAVLLDEHMPDLGGLATLQAIRADAATTLLPVIFVTGSEHLDAVAALESGANDYLVKPAHPDELVARVRAHLRGQAAWRSLLERRIQARTAVAQALCMIRPSETPQLTGLELCSRITELEEAASAAIVHFLDGGAVVLAARNATAPAGGLLPASLTARLRDAAERSAWLETRATQPAGAIGVPLMPSGTPAAAFAPLRDQGHTFGLLVLGVDPEKGRGLDPIGDLAARCLAATIDFAPIAAAVLADSLADAPSRDALSDAIRHTIAERAFRPVFQPIVDLSSGLRVGYEALTRFPGPTPPQRWFAEAASAGLTVELEHATASAAVAASRQLPGDAWLAVNVSPAFLTSGAPIVDALGDAGRPIVLEVTEHDPIEDYDAVIEAFAALGDSVRLSVDDAGAGYASLHHILALRPDFVKLDRTWITGIGDDPARQALVAGLASFASGTGATLIAEGIEEEDEREACARLSVTLGQGFLLGRPADVGA